MGDADGGLAHVVLKNGTTLQADVLIAGIGKASELPGMLYVPLRVLCPGVEPATEFARHSGLRMNDRGYIHVNAVSTLICT